MDNWRMKAKLDDRSGAISSFSSFGIGATVVNSERGQTKPILIQKGETERIRTLYGATNAEVLEAIAYNTKYPLYISAPATGIVGLWLIDKDGNAIAKGIHQNDLEKDVLDNITFSSNVLKSSVSLGTPQATVENTLMAIVEKDFIKVDEISEVKLAIFIDNKEYSITPTLDNSNNRVNLECSDTSKGSGYITMGETWSIAWTTSSEVTANEIRIINNVDLTNVLAVVGTKFTCSPYLALKVIADVEQDSYKLELKQKSDKGVYYSVINYPKQFGWLKTSVNNNGVNIYGNSYYSDDDMLFMWINDSALALHGSIENNTWVPNSPNTFAKGNLVDQRYSNRVNNARIEGWNMYKNTTEYPVDIYFSANKEDATLLASQREIAKYKRFLYSVSDNTSAKDDYSTLVPSVSNRGIMAFAGKALIRNPYESTGALVSNLIGEVAAKYADSLVLSYNGRSVAWGDENGVGGQLSMGRIIKFLHPITDIESKALDTHRINPLMPNELFGPIVASRRTTNKSSGDYSYSDFSGIVDYCIERIYFEVLPYQLVKFNDDSHRAIVRSKCENILKPLTAAPNNVIRDYAIKCDSENNTDEVLSRQEFVLTVAIKVTPKAETIVFNFTNTAQTMNVEEVV